MIHEVALYHLIFLLFTLFEKVCNLRATIASLNSHTLFRLLLRPCHFFLLHLHLHLHLHLYLQHFVLLFHRLLLALLWFFNIINRLESYKDLTPIFKAILLRLATILIYFFGFFFRKWKEKKKQNTFLISFHIFSIIMSYHQWLQPYLKRRRKEESTNAHLCQFISSFLKSWAGKQKRKQKKKKQKKKKK